MVNIHQQGPKPGDEMVEGLAQESTKHTKQKKTEIVQSSDYQRQQCKE